MSDVIQKSNNPYVAPIVQLKKKKKKNNSVRFCVDVRALNEITRMDNYPMPFIEEELESFHGKTIFHHAQAATGNS